MKRIIPSRTGIARISRRGMLKGLAAGTAGLLLNPLPRREMLAAPAGKSGRSTVSFVTGSDRREMVYEAMKPFEKEIREGIAGKKVVIKPNFVVNSVPLSATHADAVRGILDFLKPIYKQKIIIGESTLNKDGTGVAYKNYGYLDIPDKYNVELADFAEASFSRQWILDDKGHPQAVDISDPYLDPEVYMISVTRLKTHDTVVATLALKNIAMGAPFNNSEVGNVQKRKMHKGEPVGLNYNLFLLSKLVMPDFSILDGVEGMQGNGPVGGFAMDHGVVMAGNDCIAVDRVGLETMDIAYDDVGYLQWCSNAGMGQGKRDMIDIEGPDPKQYVKKYELHKNIDWQLTWKKA